MNYPIVAFLTLTITATISPGPNNIMCMTLGHKVGFKNTLKFIYGAILGSLILRIIITIFSTILYRIIPILNNYISIIGVIYLLFLAFSILKNSHNLDEKKEILSIDKLFITSFGLQFINPKNIIFTLTIVSTFIIPYFTSPIQIFGMLVLLTIIMGIMQCLWAFSGALLSKFIHKYEFIFNLIMALSLLYCAYTITENISF